MRWLPALTLCVGLTLLSGFFFFSAGPGHRPPWLTGLFLLSAAGVMALIVRRLVRALRRQTDEAIEDAERPVRARSNHPSPRA